MNAWLLAALGLWPPVIAAAITCGRGGVSGRLVALELVMSLAVFEFVLLEFAFAQPSSLGLALALALLGLPGTLVLVLFRERWL
ncbi:MAG: hypothetical protein ACREPF_07915 [Rhodanobacteraceae bacterium]